MFHKVVWQHMQGVVDFNNHFSANLPRNLLVEKFCKSVKSGQNYGHEFGGSRFLAHPVCDVWFVVGKRVPKSTLWRTDWIHGDWYLCHRQEHNTHGTPFEMNQSPATGISGV